jgi:hypothetical protein
MRAQRFYHKTGALRVLADSSTRNLRCAFALRGVNNGRLQKNKGQSKNGVSHRCN